LGFITGAADFAGRVFGCMMAVTGWGFLMGIGWWLRVMDGRARDGAGLAGRGEWLRTK
jgi:hypothetical protein